MTTQVDGARLAAGLNVVAEFDLITGTVRVINHHALELDRSARDAKLNAPKSAFVSAYNNSVTIPHAVHRRLSKEFPGSGPMINFHPVE
jgi:hypothetical protein